jgi:ATP-dependent helicase YprA (DUF1998 family)
VIGHTTGLHLGIKLCLFVCFSSAESPKCGNNNEPPDKWAAVVIVAELLKTK